MDNINLFIKELKNYRNIIPKNHIKTLRGQAINGDLKGAEKGLIKLITRYKDS